MNALRKFLKDDAGAAAIEYGLIVALVAVVLIGALVLIGTNLSGTFNSASNAIENASS